MLELEAALERILGAIRPTQSETVPLADANGRFVAAPVSSPIDLPRFDNSAVDGYAVRAQDVLTAGPEKPVRLKLIGKAAAGESFSGEMLPDSCVRLFTGSSLPKGADAVVMQEDTRIDPAATDQIQILETARPWENIRLRGEDVRQGTVVARPGDRLTAGHLNLLAATGVATLQVAVRPVVGLLATGSELVEAGHSPQAGQIFESNRVSLAALTAAAGGLPRVYPLVPDTLELTKQALAKAMDECDLVVTSGGVSVGEFDFVKPAIERLGGRLEFWKVAIRPGRPFVFGRTAQKCVFGLPGNPVSAFVTFLLLVRPALLKCQGAAVLELPACFGQLAAPISNPGDRRHFMRVNVDPAGMVASAGPQASHALSSLAAANGLIDLPPRAALAEGATVRVLRFD